MSDDARFEDAREAALNLGALDADDLQVISGLAQDAVFPITEMKWQKGARRFALLLNRFRWEDGGAARHAPERVQSLLVVDGVLHVASQGLDRSDKDVVLSLLSITFEPGEDAAGHVLLTLAGDGAIRLQVEALDVTLKDVTRPYVAPSGKTPRHPD
ncbi:DUF2948 domain-containing protein [Pelagivirga sediminicola]|uniref:DUF2948 domain-containing protein n=1 Tax=Pelagivirga sediminicola TaxID=2170575 RepID=A0A2T7G504_9RHOB|nr:DUF2948 family protein [Pelagivirga sediminicola]PVA09494.1 DUF2948 domain-containing protein [Pelagivirga sediminicola]